MALRSITADLKRGRKGGGWREGKRKGGSEREINREEGGRGKEDSRAPAKRREREGQEGAGKDGGEEL